MSSNRKNLSQLKPMRRSLPLFSPLKAAVRSKLVPIASHPALIEVREEDGVVALSGPVFERELHPLIEAAKSVPGVVDVKNELEVLHQPTPGATARGEDSFDYQPEFIVGHWAPWMRAATGILGIALLAQGLRKSNARALISSVLGAMLLSRSITNRDITRLVGTLVLPVLRMRRTLRLAAPVEDVFDFWKDFRNYPKFMSFIRSVELSDTGVLHWVAEGPGGTQLHWDTTVLELRLNQQIAWKSVPGSMIATQGVVSMEPSDLGGTTLRVELSYAPPAGALGYVAAHFLGFDPKARIDEDLEVMRMLIEDRSHLLREVA